MWDPLSDCSPLISAAASGKLRLVRLLVEGGAQVNGCNPRGETALLAACKALRGETAGPDTVKLLTYLLHNKADPNAQDHRGRTALMYACMKRAGAQVAATLLSAGADPSMEDYSGASALVYAINAQHQSTLEVLMDACRARGHDIIIIATEMGVNGGPVTRRYLNVPPSPNTSPVSCMSPSDIVLKTGSPNSPEGENIFNFRGTKDVCIEFRQDRYIGVDRGGFSPPGKTDQRGSSSNSSGGGSSQHPSCEQSPLSQCNTPSPRQRVSSEPWLAIHNLACLNSAYEEGKRERNLQEEREGEELTGEGEESEDEEGEDEDKDEDEDEDEESPLHESGMEERRDNSCCEHFLPRVSQSVLSLTEVKSSSQVTSSRVVPKMCLKPGGSTLDKKPQTSSVDQLPTCLSAHSQLRRNTLPSVMVVPPLLHLPPLVDRSDSHLQIPAQVSLSKSRSMVFLPHPPTSAPSPRASTRPSLLPPLPLSLSVNSLVTPPTSSCCRERSRRSLRRHSVQLEQIRGGQSSHLGH